MRHARRSLRHIAFNELDIFEKEKFKEWQLKRKSDWLEWKSKHPHLPGNAPVEIEHDVEHLNPEQLAEFNKWKDEMHSEHDE